jgi:fumarylpyruvate hydrolase
MAFVIAEPARPSVPVVGSQDLFPVRRIYCVGRNYAAHAREMGFDPDREPPFFFTKPADAIVRSGATLPFPLATQNLHHEIELVAAIGRGGVGIAEADALDHVWGYAVGLDMTRRDLQIASRDKGRPWDAGKAFDQSAPISALAPAARIGHPARGRIWLDVNGGKRQDSDLANLIWSVPETVAHLSRLFRLEPGDLIFTGTPDGVGQVRPGDALEGGVAGVGELKVSYAR